MTQRNGGGSAIRVLIAATSAVRRAGMEALIRNDPSLKLVGSVQGSRNLRHWIVDLQPDVLLLDLDRSEAETAELSTVGRMLSAVVLIEDPPTKWVSSALRSGVKAILPRDASMKEILPAIQAADLGFVLVGADAAKELVARVRPAPDVSAISELTPREIEVLAMLGNGLGNREMASRLGISLHTVKFHISSILSKLGAATRTEAVTLGIRLGLIAI